MKDVSLNSPLQSETQWGGAENATPRREFLRVGLAGFAGVGLADCLRLRAEAAPAAPPRERTALILVWLHGGPTHLETYDPKPDAPAEFRGPFGAIPTQVPGVYFSELLPRHAALADKFTILRSASHVATDHPQGLQYLLSGHLVAPNRTKAEHPDCLAVANYIRSQAHTRRTLPVHVGVGPLVWGGAAYLGSAYEPFAVTGDPNSPTFKVPNVGLSDSQQLHRLQRRLDLLERFDNMRRDLDSNGAMQALDQFQQQAWSLLSSNDARKAFDLSLEDPKVRERYGRHQWGQQCLMARRLVESGVDLVTVTLRRYAQKGLTSSWDDHPVNVHCFNAMKERAPYLDQAVTALVEDIYQRGLDRRVMVVVTGEFGRTPRISSFNGTPADRKSVV